MTILADTAASSDALVADVLAGEIIMLLADNFALRGFMSYLGDAAGSGSLTHSIAQLRMEGAAMDAVAECDPATAYTIESARKQVTIQRHTRAYKYSNALYGVQSVMAIGPDTLANRLVLDYEASVSEAAAALIPTFTNSVGGAADMDVATFLAAQADAEARKVGDLVWICSPKHFSDFSADLLAQGGALREDPNSRNLANLTGLGFKGSFNGVPIYTSTRLDLDGGGTAGAMVSAGAWGYADLSIPAEPGFSANNGVNAGPIRVEFDRPIGEDCTQITGHGYFGVTVLDQERATKVIAL